MEYNISYELKEWVTAALSFDFDIFDSYVKENDLVLADSTAFLKMQWNEIRITDLKLKSANTGNINYRVNQQSVEWAVMNSKVINALKQLYYERKNHNRNNNKD